MDVWHTLQLIAENLPPVAHARVAAAIVYRGHVISVGVCQYKTHPLQKKYSRNDSSVYLHAEIDAISKASRKGISIDQFRECEMYVYRAKRPHPHTEGFIAGLAKPCEGCMKAIAAVGISNIYWSE